jgi:hypothetical protein
MQLARTPPRIPDQISARGQTDAAFDRQKVVGSRKACLPLIATNGNTASLGRKETGQQNSAAESDGSSEWAVRYHLEL